LLVHREFSPIAMLQMREQAALEQGIDTTQLNPERRFLGEVSSSWHKT